MTPVECIQKIMQSVQDGREQYCQALEDFLVLLEATNDNIGEYALIEFPLQSVRGVYRNGKLQGSIHVVIGGDRIFIVCQDMREAA